MTEPRPLNGGSFARASLVMAVVKRDELSKFMFEAQPIRAIARHYDRSEETVVRAIEILKGHEAAIANGDYLSAAKDVFRGHLGWERSRSFLDARDHINRGELMPKFASGPHKKRSRRKPIKGEGTVEPTPPAVTETPVPGPVPTKSVKVALPPAAHTTRATQPVDDLFSDMALENPLLRQVNQVADKNAPRNGEKS